MDTVRRAGGDRAVQSAQLGNDLGPAARPAVTSSEGLAAMRESGREVMPTASSRISPASRAWSSQEGNSIAFAFVLAVIVIYLVLAAQFESFREPLIIMMAVPLSIFGAMIPLYLGFGTLNIYTQVGLITLIGLITKHGILMVQFANQLRATGTASPRAAIDEAAAVRLRPILMTTAAMVLGVVPLIIASGAGAAARYSIGLVIAMGMGVGTLFTLFVVPMFYTYIARRDAAPAEEAPPAAHAPAPAE